LHAQTRGVNVDGYETRGTLTHGSGRKDVEQVMADAALARQRDGSRTVVFVDEIHRFNRAQQDAFLPHVEAGDIVLIGATTENPSFEVNAALLSRSKVFVLEATAVHANGDGRSARILLELAVSVVPDAEPRVLTREHLSTLVARGLLRRCRAGSSTGRPGAASRRGGGNANDGRTTRHDAYPEAGHVGRASNGSSTG
jgi:hypothetical protein